MANTTRVGTVFLRVGNLDAQVAFYQQVLGLQVHRKEGDTVYMGAGAEDLLALIHTKDGKRYSPRAYAGLYHFAILLPERVHLARILRHFANESVRLQGLSDHIVSEAIYLADPEGNGIEVYADRPREAWFVGDDMQLDTLPLDVDSLMSELRPDTPPYEHAPAGTIMGHIHLHVRDTQEAARFYHGTLGLDLMFDIGSAVFMAYDGYHHHIGANVWGGRAPAPADALGLDHYVLYTDDVPLIAENGQLADPSGNRITLKPQTS